MLWKVMLAAECLFWRQADGGGMVKGEPNLFFVPDRHRKYF